MTPAPPARISIIVSSSAPIACILRRKPAKVWHVMKWHLKTGRIDHGSWFRGKIYGGSLSPDGKWLSYFALGSNGNLWTGVSQLPSLHAEVWIRETSTWGGGGWWDDDGALSLDQPIKSWHLDEKYRGDHKRLPFRVAAPGWKPSRQQVDRLRTRIDEFKAWHDATRRQEWFKLRLSQEPVGTRLQPGSLIEDSEGAILLALRGRVERWTTKDRSRGQPSTSIDLEDLEPVWNSGPRPPRTP